MTVVHDLHVFWHKMKTTYQQYSYMQFISRLQKYSYSFNVSVTLTKNFLLNMTDTY